MLLFLLYQTLLNKQKTSRKKSRTKSKIEIIKNHREGSFHFSSKFSALFGIRTFSLPFLARFITVANNLQHHQIVNDPILSLNYASLAFLFPFRKVTPLCQVFNTKGCVFMISFNFVSYQFSFFQPSGISIFCLPKSHDNCIINLQDLCISFKMSK